MAESDGRMPASDPRIVRRLDAIVALLAVIATALVLDFVEVEGRDAAAAVALIAVAVGLFYWTAILARSDG